MSTFTEESAAQTHFIELCQVLGKPWPAPGNPLSAVYAFEKGVEKTGGGRGFADVWLAGHFAWEYKEALENPPLLVVCDLDRFEMNTNFTNTAKRVYAFDLAELLTPRICMLTNLYDERPSWLALAHEKLDRAVLDAYGWPHDLSDEELLERLLALNGERATVAG